ncbi:hypothetical protein GGI11_001440 [Coemansia sp. RSA 2049]|nr:hypothetical protein GGI11_001440 [Coemansia sp. RSA 2049]
MTAEENTPSPASDIGSSSKSPLFVKDGEDIFIQRSSNDSGSCKQSVGYRTSVYKHFESNMRFVVCRVPSPIYTLNIYVPTAVTDNKGLPHTLEHLIFCGSKRYPVRGYLDVLAAHNYSVGTNAWTDSDHTCYTLDAAAEDAVANVLPAFLDHVLNPLLRDDHFVTEVYHYDETGKEQGVVFSEMVSYENNEEELSSYHLNNLVYNTSATYAGYSGGKTRDIANLTNSEIIDYHRKYYDANNVTIVLTGAFSDDFEDRYLQTIPADIIQSHGHDSREPMDCSPPKNSIVLQETVKFPSLGTDVGSFDFGWCGPPHEDVETIIALDILMEYLAGTSSSPLDLRFVERPSPLASSVSVGVNDNITRMLNMTFSGVPYPHNEPTDRAEGSSDDEENGEAHDCDDEDDDAEDPDIPCLFDDGYLQNLLLEELQRIFDSRFDGDPHALANAAKRLSDGLASKIEKSPGEALQELFAPDIVASHFSQGSRGRFRIGLLANQFDVIAELGKRPIEFWLGLLKKWLIDGTVYSIAMVPDSELGPKLELERKEREQANEAKIVDKEAHSRYIREAVESNKANVPDKMKRGMPTPDPSKTAILPHTQSLVVLEKAIGPVTAVQTINADSGFVEAQIQIPIGDIPEDQRAYLALFQGLLMNTDLVLPAGVVYDDDSSDTPLKTEKRIPYAEFEGKLSDIVTSRYSCVGQMPKLFACYWLDDIFVVDFLAPCKRYARALRWIVQSLLFSDFTADRILACGQNMLTTIAEMKRDVDELVFTVGVHFTNTSPVSGSLTNRRHTSFLAQEGVLKGIIENVKTGKAENVISRLRDIQSTLVQATGGFMALSLPSNEDPKPYVDTFACEWSMSYRKYAERNNLAAVVPTPKTVVNKSPFPIYYQCVFPALTKPLLVHVPVQSLQAAMSRFSFKLDIPFCPTGKRSFDDELADLISLDCFALQMLTSLLGRIDGPLSNAVRGKGYSYGASMFHLQWTKEFVLEVDRASDIVKAVGAIKQLLLDIKDNWGAYVGDTDVSLARSVVKYGITLGQSTPKRMLRSSISNSIHGFSSAKECNTWCSTHIAAVKMSDMRRVFEKYVLPFADDAYPMFRLLVTPLDTEVPAELGPFERMTLENISATYKTDY